MKYVISSINSFLTNVTYRSNFIISLLSKIIQLSLSFFMWNHIYSSPYQSINGYTKYNMFLYFTLTGVLSLLFTFEPIFNISNKIQSGKISVLLLRPINIKKENFANFLGSKIIFIAIFLLINSILFFNNIIFFLFIIFYMIISIILWHEIMFLIGICAFWIVQMWPLRPVINAFYTFFGGILFPLDILPNTIYIILQYFPVSLVSSDFIQSIVKNQEDIKKVCIYILASLIWIIILKTLSSIVFKKGLRKFEGIGI